MRENRPSVTAQRVAMRRAAHQLLDRPVVLDDPIALRIIGDDAAARLRADPLAFEHGRITRSLRAFLVARSRTAEDELAAAVARGVRRYVVLGAGLDTFAYRNPFPDVRVFEVDHPATQGWKRERLHLAGIAVPEHVTFAPVDFAAEDLADVLVRAGLDRRTPTFFSWLGVTPYLVPDAVRATLRVAAEFARGGGGIVFDYALPRESLGLLERMVFDRFARRVEAAGEPWHGFFDPAALAADLRQMGFEPEDLGPLALNARYFAGRADGLRVGSLAHVMIARA